MKDLYRKLALERSASPEEIKAALENRPDAERYSAILLDAERRALYDRVHTTLKMIGTLRFRLGLDNSDAWFITRYPDFAIMPKPTLGAAAQENPADQEPDNPPKSPARLRRGRRRWLLPALLALLVLVAIGLFLTFY